MRSKTLFTLILLSGLLAPHVWAEPAVAPAVTPAATTATPSQKDVIPPKGSLYRIRHQGNTSYLFGTIHVGKPGFYPLETRATDALAGAGKLVVEFDVRNSAQVLAAVGKYGTYGAGDSIEKHVSREALRELRQALLKYGIPFEALAQMKPWMVANLLLIVELERNGYSASQGTDLFLLAQATADTKPVEELETADYQLSLFDGMTAKQQEQYLRESLEELTSGKAMRKSVELLTAWSKADSAAFDDVLRETAKENTTSSKFMLTKLLNKRNREMADKLDGLFKREKSSFVAVGVMHLVGEDGLPGLLRKRGFEVERVY